MTRTCDNCRRPVLDTDSVCWHCGWKLTPRPVEKEKTTAIETEQESELEPTSLPLIIFYGVLTLFIIIVLLRVMNSLASSPTISAVGLPSTEWVVLKDPSRQFIIQVPAQWRWFFRKEIEAETDLAGFLENNEWLQIATAPLGSFLPDGETHFIAGNDSVLLVVTRSERLNRLTAEQLAASLRQENFPGLSVENVRQKQNSSEEIGTIFTVIHNDPAIQCHQLFMPGSEAAYLVSACAAAEDNAEFKDQFDRSLDSFQIQSR